MHPFGYSKDMVAFFILKIWQPFYSEYSELKKVYNKLDKGRFV